MASIVSAGTTSATALNMSADTTGILQLASNNGTVGLTMDTSQNVGIGTSSPSLKLDIQTTVAGPFSARIYNSATTGNSYSQLQLQTDAGNFYIFKQNSTNTTNAGAGCISLYGDGAYPMTFSTNGLERMRITSAGRVGIGTTTPTSDSIATVYNGSAGSFGFNILNASASGYGLSIGTDSAPAVYFYSNSARSVLAGGISVSGSTTTYTTSSDYRLKNTIAPMINALAKVALLKPCTYKWNADGSDGEGFIAHELAEVYPSAVAGEKDAVDENGNIRPQGIDTSFLVATLTAAIQELNAKVTALEEQVLNLGVK